jgi:hypothetical protein
MNVIQELFASSQQPTMDRLANKLELKQQVNLVETVCMLAAQAIFAVPHPTTLAKQSTQLQLLALTLPIAHLDPFASVLMLPEQLIATELDTTALALRKVLPSFNASPINLALVLLLLQILAANKNANLITRNPFLAPARSTTPCMVNASTTPTAEVSQFGLSLSSSSSPSSLFWLSSSLSSS